MKEEAEKHRDDEAHIKDEKPVFCQKCGSKNNLDKKLKESYFCQECGENNLLNNK